MFCVPRIEKHRYYSVQLTDMYSLNYGYVGSRTTGNGGGCYLIAGPSWRGEGPPGIERAFRSETQFGLVTFRTQLFNRDDVVNVRKIQASYAAEPLSSFVHAAAPTLPPAPDFPVFTRTALGPEFPKYLIFFCNSVRWFLKKPPCVPSFRFQQIAGSAKDEIGARCEEGI